MKVIIVVLMLLLLGGGAALWYYQSMAPEQPREVAVPPTVSPSEPFEKREDTQPRPKPRKPPTAEPRSDDITNGEMELTQAPEPEPDPLPELVNSDAEAAAAAAELMGEDAAIRYLVNDAMIARAVASIDSLSARQVPGNVMAVQAPEAPFEATADEWPDQIILNEAGDPIDQFVSSPANHQRYTPYVELFEAVDSQQIAATYERYQPLFQEAYAQLGYGSESFDQRLLEVIDELLATPEVEEPVQLKKPEAFYLFVDEDLEALTAGQKILIRMGPDNASRVKAKLKALRDSLAQVD